MFRTLALQPTTIILAITTFLTLLTISTTILRAILTTFNHKTTFFHILDTRFFLWILTAFVLLLDTNPYPLAALLAITATTYLLAYEAVLKLDLATATLTLIFDSLFTTLSFLTIAHLYL